MSSYDDLQKNALVPLWIKEVVTSGLSICAILLYGGILAVALYRTMTSDTPFITYGMEHAVALLSGLVGTVVTAGFARGSRSASVQARGLRPVGAKPPSLWTRLELGALLKGKMMGLARTVSLPTVSRSVSPMTDEAQPSTQRGNQTSMTMAIVYFAVYFLAGGVALVLTLLNESVPDIVSNAGWVWLGTVISAGYAFFGINPE